MVARGEIVPDVLGKALKREEGDSEEEEGRRTDVTARAAC